MPVLHCHPEFASLLPDDQDPFDFLFQQTGPIFKQKDNRRTLRFELQGQGYFLKAHGGVGWKEVIKALLRGQRPVLDASPEWRAIQRLESLGLPTTPLMAWGRRGHNPAGRQSLTVTRDLGETVSLEALGATWSEHRPPPAFKWALIRAVAHIAATLHQNGMNHRDFYLCHLLLDRKTQDTLQPRVFLIDLHRMQIRRDTPRRWHEKDLGSLWFSAMDSGLTRRDQLRFLAAYRPGNLRQILQRDRRFLERTERRAQRMYRRFYGREVDSAHGTAAEQ